MRGTTAITDDHTNMKARMMMIVFLRVRYQSILVASVMVVLYSLKTKSVIAETCVADNDDDEESTLREFVILDDDDSALLTLNDEHISHMHSTLVAV